MKIVIFGLVAGLLATAAASQEIEPPLPIARAIEPGFSWPPNFPQQLPYGTNITLEQAKVVANAARADGRRRGANMTIAVVDTAGELVYYEKASTAPYASFNLAVGKAKAAARTRRPTAFDADRLAAGFNLVLFLPDIFPAPGGRLIVVDGKVIGGVGITGGFDDEVATVASQALNAAATTARPAPAR